MSSIVKGIIGESEEFDKADKTIHSVENQWHFKILTKAGFKPETPTGTGFVRSYTYRHPDGRSVVATTGSNADYWESSDGQHGYWGSLEKYASRPSESPVKAITGES